MVAAGVDDSRNTRKERRKARRSAAALNLDKRPAVNPTGIDVELVTMPPPAAPIIAAPPAAPQKLFSLPLTRRDVCMFGIGVGTVVVGAGIGLLGALFSGAFRKKDPEQEEGEKE